MRTDVEAAPRPATLADRRRVVVRPATPADLPALRTFLDGLAPASAYARFFTPRPRLDDGQLMVLASTAPGHGALLAVPEGACGPIAAFGSYVYERDLDSCEIGIAVADAWQNAGLGTLVVLLLVRAATVEGMRRFHAEVLGGNVRMLSLLRTLGAPHRTRLEGGVAHVEFSLPAGNIAPGLAVP